MRVAIYVRVSKGDMHPENQKIQLIEYAKRQGWNYEVFEEKESTRKTRPIKNNLFNLLRRGMYDAVLVWRLDRWARSTSELALEIEELHLKGISFISLKDNIDLSTATGKLQFHIISAFAEFEREIIRERTLAGLERAKMQGKRLGRPKGSKDKKKRRKAGYFLRWQNASKKSPPEKRI